MAHQNRFPAQTADDNSFAYTRRSVCNHGIRNFPYLPSFSLCGKRTFFPPNGSTTPHAHNIHDIQHAEEGRFAGKARSLFAVGLCNIWAHSGMRMDMMDIYWPLSLSSRPATTYSPLPPPPSPIAESFGGAFIKLVIVPLRYWKIIFPLVYGHAFSGQAPLLFSSVKNVLHGLWDSQAAYPSVALVFYPSLVGVFLSVFRGCDVPSFVASSKTATIIHKLRSAECDLLSYAELLALLNTVVELPRYWGGPDASKSGAIRSPPGLIRPNLEYTLQNAGSKHKADLGS
ncbi:hypothetical protein C8R44DRAFT_736952 [Mycena epipterygia]|nr:hypothetical protein C8R44DRAFT_736952 [Mycena epipterygia]